MLRKVLQTIGIGLALFVGTSQSLAQTDTITVTFNLRGNEDEITGKSISVDFAANDALWDKPEVSTLEVAILRPLDIWYGRDYDHDAFVKKMAEAGWGEVPTWVVLQMYADMADQDHPLWFHMRPVMNLKGAPTPSVYCLGPNSTGADRLHDIFYGKLPEPGKFPNNRWWVFARPVRK